MASAYLTTDERLELLHLELSVRQFGRWQGGVRADFKRRVESCAIGNCGHFSPILDDVAKLRFRRLNPTDGRLVLRFPFRTRSCGCGIRARAMARR